MILKVVVTMVYPCLWLKANEATWYVNEKLNDVVT
jgi:hypothetical protein